MTTVAEDAYVDDTKTFDSLNLDARLAQALKEMGFKHPTLVQSSAIPLAIEGKHDIIAKASTGSGKTTAYLVPILQSILENPDGSGVRAVVLVPTKELSNQVHETCRAFAKFCGGKVDVVNMASSYTPKILSTLLAAEPEIVITTPNKLVKLLEPEDGSEPLLDADKLKSSLEFLVVDEVDLMFSYGYQEDLEKIAELVDASNLRLQAFFMSATLPDDIVDEIKLKFCKSPKILRLNDELITKNKDRLVQYYIKTSEFDKFLMVYVILKLGLIKGKTLLFVNNIERGYKLKLFLEQFGIRSCLLNSEMPLNLRLHVIDQFNKNYYNLLISTDEVNQAAEEAEEAEIKQENKEDQEPLKEEQEPSNEATKEEDNKTLSEKQITKQNTKLNQPKKKQSDSEYGVSRGVDFRNVACVLNFDLPTTSKNYVHRIGRTARANKSGIALSFVVKLKEWGKHRPSSLLTAKKDEKIFARILSKQKKLGLDVVPYKFNQEHLESFRYRVEDAFRAVTGTAVKEARLREIKHEIMASDKLKRHFEENPQDLEALRHDKALHAARVQMHLRNVPEYLLPDSLKRKTAVTGFVPFNKNNKRRKGAKGGKGRSKGKKRADPLKSFKTR